MPIHWNLYTYIISKYELTGWGAFGLKAGCLLLCILIPYLLGSFNFGLIISREKFHDDVRTHGSGNAGTTNMLRTYGKGAAAMTLAGDMLKAAVAVILGYLLINESREVTGEGVKDVIYNNIGAAVAGLFVVVGHMFPCFFHFKGGKGVATTAMVVLLLNPIVFLILFVIFAIIVAATKYVSLASVIGMCLYPIMMSTFDGYGSIATPLSVVMTCLVVFMHRENLKRLRDGKESKISFGKKKSAETPASPDPAELTGKAKRTAKKAQHEADLRAAAEEPEYDFVTCTGCGSLIPMARKTCAYCGTKNAQYRPDPRDGGKKRGKR